MKALKGQDYNGLLNYYRAIKSIMNLKEDSVYERLREILFDKILQIKSTHAAF